MSRSTVLALTTLLAVAPAAIATELVLPVFALNADLGDRDRLSTEIYLVNPTQQPVQVGLAGILPGRVHRPTPCGEFMSQTRVVPPRSAVVWTASGLATDLGCADEVLGALMLRADGHVRVTGRLVRHAEHPEGTPLGVLVGGGQPVQAIPVGQLPGPTTLLLPALLCHRNPCGEPAFTTTVWLANPGPDPVAATFYLPQEARRGVRFNGRIESLPHQVVVEPERWTQIKIAPLNRPEGGCLEPESFDLELVLDGPLAVLGSVVESESADGRTVRPVDLERD